MEKISNLDELLAIEKNGQYELNNDIDGHNVTIPYLIRYFKGTIDGNGHSIRNIIISDEVWGDEQTIALFCNMSKAELSNIVFENISLDYRRGSYHPRIGALAGQCSDCKIENVIMSVMNSSDNETSMIYEVSNCEMHGNKMKCNGKEVSIAKYY